MTRIHFLKKYSDVKEKYFYFLGNYFISWAFLSCAYHWRAIGNLIWRAHKVMSLVKAWVFCPVMLFLLCHDFIKYYMYSDVPVFPAIRLLNAGKWCFLKFCLFQTQMTCFPLWNTKVEWGLDEKTLYTKFSVVIW